MTEPKMRHCANCGAQLGLIEARNYDRNDTCGARECERAMRDMEAEEREQAHSDLDERMGW